jgi:hypothetical protein
MASAAGLRRTNQGETMALTAAALVAAQPAPLSASAGSSCHGSAATAQPATPTASASAPALVVAATPKRRCSAGRLATATAPIRKCTVTAVETSASGQPVASRTACRYTGGP